MAKVKLRVSKPPVGQGLRRRVVFRNTKHGIVVQAWPRKRGPHKDFAQHWRSQLFAYAARWSANAEQRSYETAVNWTKGTYWLPRDLLTALAYGKYLEVFGADGKRWPRNPHRPPIIPKDLPMFNGCALERTTNLAYTNSAALLLPWQSVIIDTAQFFDPSAPTKMTIPENGLVVQAYGGVRFTGSDSALLSLSIIDSASSRLANIITRVGTTKGATITTPPLLLPAGETIEFSLFSSAGGTVIAEGSTFFGLNVLGRNGVT